MRYSRQELLNFIGKEGQEKISNSTVAIVGLGATGSVSAELLARAGAGTLILIDRDIIELSNLQRQSLYTEDDIGKTKASRAREHLRKINSTIVLKAFTDDLTYHNIADLLDGADIILDCADNMETRFLINEYCVQNNKPWIYSAAIRTEGYILTINPKDFCFSCIFNNLISEETCDMSGALNTITHAIATLQAQETLQYVLNKQQKKKLYHLNYGERPSIESLTVKKNKDCSVCVHKTFNYLTGKKRQSIISCCGTGMYQIRHKTPIDIQMIKKNLERLGNVKDVDMFLQFDTMYIFKDRALIHAKTKQEAKNLYSKYVGGL